MLVKIERIVSRSETSLNGKADLEDFWGSEELHTHPVLALGCGSDFWEWQVNEHVVGRIPASVGQAKRTSVSCLQGTVYALPVNRLLHW